MAQQIQLRNDTTAGWAYANPVLTQAEIGVDTTLGKFKIGDGTSTWTELQFQSASIADFVFTASPPSDDSTVGRSTIEIANKDLYIQTTRDENVDADIEIVSADDLRVTAHDVLTIFSETDDIRIRANDDVTITANYPQPGIENPAPSKTWIFREAGEIEFPDGSVQTTAYTGLNQPLIPLPDFLTYATGREALPGLNTNFGWDNNGLWFGNATGGGTSYPVFTDFTLSSTDKVTVNFKVDIQDECSDVGLCVYLDGATPIWNYGTDSTRIAAQFDCSDPQIMGATESQSGGFNISDPGLHRIQFTYDPNAVTDKVVFELFTLSDGVATLVGAITADEGLASGAYRIGFAADNNGLNSKTYISDLDISINDEQTIYSDSLKSGDSSTASDLVVPVIVKDTNGENFITFTRTGTGTARIEAPQDDLSLRSPADITLFAGTDGPGNVYIGWGDAEYTPNASNRVATIGDIESAPKTYTASNEARYGTYQASGFVEVTSNAATGFTAQVYSPDGTYNVTSTVLLVDQTANDLLATNPSWREITITDKTNSVRVLRNPTYQSSTEGGYLWVFGCDGTLVLDTGTAYTVNGSYGGAPIIWWNADNENPTNGDFTNSNFRGAKIEYHAYVEDSGTVVGTIYIADDSNDRNVTHMETASGGNDVGTAIFWNRSGSEEELCLYRTDGESVLHKIQWTAQMYYATEVYDD